MKKVSVTEAKNGLSRLLIEVGRGESVLIINRGTPVARIEPYYTNRLGHDQAAADLIRRGIADPPAEPCDVEHLLGTPSPSLPEGVSAREAGAAQAETRLAQAATPRQAAEARVAELQALLRRNRGNDSAPGG